MSLVVVSGALANKCGNGGNAWTRLSWLLGFKRLGFDVFFIEQISAENCIGPSGVPAPLEQSDNLAYFQSVLGDFGLSQSAALICPDGPSAGAGTYESLLDVAAAAELLLNIGGHLRLEPLRRAFRRSVFLDDDPGYTQFWQAAGLAGDQLPNHDFYFTFGGNIGLPECCIPTGGISWRHTRPPVTLDDWPCRPRREPGPLTTIASWRGPYGAVEFGGNRYGQKAHEFRKFVDVPLRCPEQTFEIALDIDPADRADLDLLDEHGWKIRDPKAVAAGPAAFRDYVQESGAEFSVAQGIYVDTRSGWFSDRTVRYLASGRPVVVQGTGFERNYPVGEGLLPFTSLQQATDAVRSIVQDYQTHAQAARAVAESFFDSDLVVSELLEQVEVAP